MPVLLRWLSRIGIAAMLWVGGHILIAGTAELGWHGPHDIVHDLEHEVEGGGGVLAWLVNTAASAVVGIVVGLLAVAVVGRISALRSKPSHAPA
jgi:uncharacterized protein